MPGFPETVKAALSGIVSDMAKDPKAFVRNPLTDFTRDRMLNFGNTVSLILSMEAGSISQELLDDFRAFCDMVDRLPQEGAADSLFIADRGFASFNAYAHVIEKGAVFLIRSKEVGASCFAGVSRPYILTR